MNGFTHALPFLDNPYFAVGCCLPDWLSICDRKCRAHEKNARKFVEDPDPVVSIVARGVVQHHQDDAWFHATPIFNKLMLDFSVELKRIHGGERTMRPGFVGHILVELLLDAFLSSQHPGKMEVFYQQTAALDREKIQLAINQFATRPTDRLAGEIQRFVNARYWFDYETDEGLMFRINQVLRRVRLEPLGEPFANWLPGARERVYSNAAGLLPEYGVEI
jgi:hypothetical protein